MPGNLGPLGIGYRTPANWTYDQLVLADSPLFYYSDFPTGATVAADTSGYALNGVFGGTLGTDYTLGAASILPGDPSSHAINFPNVGGSGGVRTPYLSLNSFSLEFWAVFPDTSSWQMPVAYPSSGQNGVTLWLNGGAPANSIGWSMGQVQSWSDSAGGSHSGNPIVSSGISPNTLYHVVVSYDQESGIQTLVVNGTPQVLTGIGWYPNGCVPIYFGCLAFGTFGVKGPYQKIAGYLGLLPLSRIKAHYAAGVA